MTASSDTFSFVRQNRGHGLSVLNLTVVNHLYQLVKIVALHIQKLILIKMLFSGF